MALQRMKRVTRAEAQIARVPVPDDVLEAAVERFRTTGRLPEVQHIAGSVTRRILALHPPKRPERTSEEILAEQWARITARREGRTLPVVEQPMTVREHLFDEAVYAPSFVRRVARAALRSVVRDGGDIAAPDLLEDRGLPERGTVGMHVLRVYDRLARPPYEERARELLERHGALVDQMRAHRVGHAEVVDAAFDAFTERGEIPLSETMRHAVLAALELEALVHHGRGADVEDLLFLIDAANEDGDLRDKALRTIPDVLRRGYRRRSS